MEIIINRVFFHELGHFVARELNFKFYSGTGTKEILIMPCGDKSLGEYCGQIIPNVPEGIDLEMKIPVPLNRLAEHLAALTYGCIFQAYNLNTDLEDCFNANGRKDLNSWRCSLISNKLGSFRQDIFEAEKEYFNKLLKNKSLEDFMKIEFKNYLKLENDNLYVIEIDRLREDLSYTVNNHYSQYQELILTYKSILKIDV